MEQRKLNIVKKITSKYILREIFSFIDYNRTKKLVKYNFKLYERLGMKLEDYTLTFNYYIKEVKESVPSIPKKDTMIFRTVLIIILIIMNLLINIGVGTGFPENYSEKWSNFQIHLNTFFYSFLSPLLFISFFWIVCSNCNYNAFCLFFMIVINFLNIIAFIVTIVKIGVNKHYESEINTINLICDILLLILFPFLIILYFIYIYKCKDIMRGYHYVNKFIINEFRGFKVDDYFLNIDFNIKRKEEQREILMNSRFGYSISKEQEELIGLINEFRANNCLKNLFSNRFEYLNDYFKITNTNKFINLKNIIEIDENIYLFIYPIAKFKNDFKNNDKNILDILKIPFLEQILIFENERNQHILVYDYNQIYKRKINLHYYNNINRRTERSSDILNINTKNNFFS